MVFLFNGFNSVGQKFLEQWFNIESKSLCKLTLDTTKIWMEMSKHEHSSAYADLYSVNSMYAQIDRWNAIGHTSIDSLKESYFFFLYQSIYVCITSGK